MPRARPWLHTGKWRIIRRQRPILAEPIDQQLVEAKISGHRKVIRLVDVDGMPVRLLLPLRVDALALVLHEGGDLAKRTVGLDGNGRHTAAAIVGGQHVLARPIDDEMAWTVAARRLL